MNLNDQRFVLATIDHLADMQPFRDQPFQTFKPNNMLHFGLFRCPTRAQEQPKNEIAPQHEKRDSQEPI
jgi:hypothetical protein